MLLKKHVAMLGSDQFFADADNTTLDHQDYTILVNCMIVRLFHYITRHIQMTTCNLVNHIF
jgi:hypothetical protein